MFVDSGYLYGRSTAHPGEMLQGHCRPWGHRCHPRTSQELPGWIGSDILKIHTMMPTLRATLRLLASPVMHEEIKSEHQEIKELVSGVWAWVDVV